MGFNTLARQARSPDVPLLTRRRALRSCLLRLSRWTGEKYGEIQARYNTQFGFNDTDLPSADSLLRAIAAVEVERNIYVERLRAFEKRRVKAKARGRRQMTKQEQREGALLGQGHRLTFP